MGNVNAWVCACEREHGAGNKCEHCRHAIMNDFSNQMCQYYGQCQKKFGW